MGDRSGGRHTAAPNFGSIKVNNGSIIAAKSKLQACDIGNIGNREFFPEVSCDEFIATVSSESNLCSFSALGSVSISEFGLPAGP